MLARMSGKAEQAHRAKTAPCLGDAMRREFPLLIGLGTAAIFFAAGSQLVELIAHPVALIGVFVWLFAVILWSAMCVVRHADCLAIKLGEPYGTLILTLSAISVEVVMISTAMLHGANNPTLGRDAIFAVIMIALNGLVGLSLMLGGLRYREQHYNIQGVNAYLNVIMALRVFGLTDWYRDGTLAEYAAVEARNLTPLPGDVDFTVGASLPISGLTAWQGLFQHGRLRAGQSVIAHGAAGAVGSMVTQLAREAGAYVIGTGRAADRQKALDFGANEFVDLENDDLKDVGGVDLVFDVIGGDIQKRSAGLIRAGGTLVTIVGPAEARPADGLAVDFVVESDRAQLTEIVQRVRAGRLRTNIGNVATLDDAVAALNSTERATGKTVIRVRP